MLLHLKPSTSSDFSFPRETQMLTNDLRSPQDNKSSNYGDVSNGSWKIRDHEREQEIPDSSDSCLSEDTGSETEDGVTEGLTSDSKVASANSLTVSKRRRGKQVSFCGETKVWDGLKPIHTDFDELLYCFLVKGQSIGDGDILKWTSIDCFRIFQLCTLLYDLIRRLKADTDSEEAKQVPCLPAGGGRAMRVESAYEPYLRSLLSVLATALHLALKSPNRKNTEEISTEQDLLLLRHFVENKGDAEKLAASL